MPSDQDLRASRPPLSTAPRAQDCQRCHAEAFPYSPTASARARGVALELELGALREEMDDVRQELRRLQQRADHEVQLGGPESDDRMDRQTFLKRHIQTQRWWQQAYLQMRYHE